MQGSERIYLRNLTVSLTLNVDGFNLSILNGSFVPPVHIISVEGNLNDFVYQRESMTLNVSVGGEARVDITVQHDQPELEMVVEATRRSGTAPLLVKILTDANGRWEALAADLVIWAEVSIDA